MELSPEAMAIATFAVGLPVAAVTTVLLLRLQGRTINRRVAQFDSILDPYRRGDYAAALQATEILKPDSREYWFYRGSMLLELGRLGEAEDSLKKAIALAEQRELAIQGRGVRGGIAAMEASVKSTALCKSTLGEVYLDQGRYDEAMRCFESSLTDWPGHGSVHRKMAEACLRRAQPVEALEWAKLAVQETRRVLDPPVRDARLKSNLDQVHHTNLAEALATLAWAVAAASRDRDEVHRLIAEASEHAGGRNASTSGLINFQAGAACAALGDPERAACFWEEAARADPNGRWGREAKNKIAEPLTSPR